MAPTHNASRWAQLTYASFDPGNGVGGWQVKETRGDLSPAELREISTHLVTAFDSHAPLPEYPTPGDIAAQPRKCMYLLARGGHLGGGVGPASAVTTGCTIHAVQAGNDSTGRPGNVFSHVVLDRDPQADAPQLRPIEVWRSFDLLTPYGTEQVLAAQLADGDFPEPSGLAGRELVLEFIFDPTTWRMGLLGVLLDAVDEAMRGGRRVVLVTEGPDQAAMWIAAASWCMSPGTARALSWSVYERAARIRNAFERGVHVAAVPRADAGLLDRDDPDTVILDDAELPSLGQLGVQPHRTAHGQEIRVTPWSVLTHEALIDAPAASGVLALMDDIAGRVRDWGLTPAWPLAVAHLMSAPDEADTSLAAHVAGAEAPAGEIDPWIAGVIRDALLAGLGEGTAGVWQAVSEAAPGSRRAELLAVEYTRRALRDRTWLARDGGVPARPIPPQLVDEDLTAAVRDIAADADPVVALRGVDVAARSALLDDRDRRAAIVSALGSAVAPTLVRSTREAGQADEAGFDAADGRAADAPVTEGPVAAAGGGGADPTTFLHRVGRLDVRMHHDLVPRAIEAHLERDDDALASEPGRLLWPTASAWLVDHGLPPVTGEPPTPAANALRLELALWLATNRPDAADGHALVSGLFERYGSWFGTPSHYRVVEPRHLWRVDELLDLERRFPGALPERFVAAHFACAPVTHELTELAEAVGRRSSGVEAALARLRLEAQAHDGAEVPPVTPAATALELGVRMWTAHPQHVAAHLFAPVMLRAGLNRAVDAMSSSTVASASPAELELIRACGTVPTAVARVADRLVREARRTSASNANETMAAVLALDVATSGVIDRPHSALAGELAAVRDEHGARMPEALLAALLPMIDDGDGEHAQRIATMAARRLAGLRGGDEPPQELETAARRRLQAPESRQTGIAASRQRRHRQVKEY